MAGGNGREGSGFFDVDPEVNWEIGRAIEGVLESSSTIDLVEPIRK
jgi:hypothetical protein